MSEGTNASRTHTPWHLWLVGVLGMFWNVVGAWDYLATQTQNESYMSRFTPEQLEFFYGFPSWVVALWAIAVWGGVLGAVLLVLRRRLAAPVLLVSFLSMMATAAHNFVLANGAEIMGTGGVVFTGLIFLVALGLMLYAGAMSRRGVLT